MIWGNTNRPQGRSSPTVMGNQSIEITSRPSYLFSFCKKTIGQFTEILGVWICFLEQLNNIHQILLKWVTEQINGYISKYSQQRTVTIFICSFIEIIW